MCGIAGVLRSDQPVATREVELTSSPEDPAVGMRVRHQETDDEEEPLYRGADDRRAA